MLLGPFTLAGLLLSAPAWAGTICRAGVCVTVSDDAASRFQDSWQNDPGTTVVIVGPATGGGGGVPPTGGDGGGGGQATTPTDQLAGLKRQYEEIKKSDPGDPRLDELQQQADRLRAQGADERKANEAVYANPCGAFGCPGDVVDYGDQSPGQGGNVNLGGTSYYSSNGNAVAWAGGDNIVVFDPNGNRAWEGEGERRPDGRIIPPADVRDQLGFGVAPAYGIGSPTFFDTGDGGEAGVREGGQSSQAQSPFPNAPDYAGMQPVTLTLADGRTVEGYANVYHDADGLGYSAIPATSDLGKGLTRAGFGLDQASDQVFIHNGAPGATIGWDRASGAAGPSLTNLGTTCEWCTGGLISLQIGTAGTGGPGLPDGGAGGNPNTVIFPPTIQGITASPATVRFGDWLDVAVSTVGHTDRVTVRVSHRRADLPVDRFEYALTRQHGSSPGVQTWTARIRVDWITAEEFQSAMRQQDGAQQWADLCLCTIPPYEIEVSASGPGGSTPGRLDVNVQGTTIWVVPVPAGD